ncbi:pyridoxal-phosphate dependent enzyme [Candidatus Vidania fulgoroideorum]
MIYLSTISKNKKYSFIDLIYNNIPKKGSLLIPKEIKKIKFKKNNYFYILKKLFKFFIGKKLYNKIKIEKIIRKIYLKKKKTEIKKIKNKKTFFIDLNKGKTFSFKDFSISFIVELLSNIDKKNKTIITATSGDTGASSSYYISLKKRLKNIILSPYKGVSNFQESQMYGILSKNIFNISIKGNFDDCQKIVKNMITKEKLFTINSINFIRIILQSSYYIKYSNIIYKKYKKKPFFCIPTGNFGNALSCYIAKILNNKIKGSFVSNNENNYTYMFFKNIIKKKKIIKTDCPSIDINIPSNLERYIYMLIGYNKYKYYLKKKNYLIDIIKKNNFFSFFYSKKKERKKIIKKFYKNNKNILDTHTSNAFLSYKKNKIKNEIYVILNTANYIKFKNIIEEFINKKIKIKHYDKIIRVRKKFFYFESKDKKKIYNFIKINK